MGAATTALLEPCLGYSSCPPPTHSVSFLDALGKPAKPLPASRLRAVSEAMAVNVAAVKKGIANPQDMDSAQG